MSRNNEGINLCRSINLSFQIIVSQINLTFTNLGKNEEGTISTPIIVNGVTEVNCNAESDQKYSNSTEDCINKLKRLVTVTNTSMLFVKKKTIILIGDSNIKSCV